MSYKLTCQRAMCAYVPKCQCALRAYVLRWQHALHAYMLTCQHALRSHMLTCQYVLRAHVPTCLVCFVNFNNTFSLHFCDCSLSFSCEIKLLHILAFLLPVKSLQWVLWQTLYNKMVWILSEHDFGVVLKWFIKSDK